MRMRSNAVVGPLGGGLGVVFCAVFAASFFFFLLNLVNEILLARSYSSHVTFSCGKIT